MMNCVLSVNEWEIIRFMGFLWNKVERSKFKHFLGYVEINSLQKQTHIHKRNLCVQMIMFIMINPTQQMHFED